MGDTNTDGLVTSGEFEAYAEIAASSIVLSNSQQHPTTKLPPSKLAAKVRKSSKLMMPYTYRRPHYLRYIEYS